ncbi:MAG: small conductance mechanosensitive channel [Methyloprofundus sp.]|nr:MAG: small conductance mechanosensitive channel [Methyloprofundus sp.]
MFSFVKPLILMLSILLAINAAPILAKEAAERQVPLSSTNPQIELDVLDIVMAPLTVEELKTEADGWLKLIKASAHKVAKAKLRIKYLSQKQKSAEQAQVDSRAEKADKGKDSAMDELTDLRAIRTAEIDRLNVVLARINQKTGLDANGKESEAVLAYRRYSDAVGGIKLDTTDAESSFASIKGWLASKEGGKRWGVNLGSFLFIMLISWMLARIFSGMTRRALTLASKQSKLLTDFLVSMTSRVVMIIGIIFGLSVLEVDIGPLLAVIGAAGFVVAFALQSTLSNFASGIMIMIYRPFDVSDAVEVAGINGKVSSLNLVSTTITTFDNKRMIVPNNEIWGNTITNASASNERRVDMVFGIGYGDDIDLAMQVLEDIVATHPLILTDPAAVIQLHELADSSVNFICRPWVKTADYWTVYWDVTRNVKVRFDAEGLSIPYPQQDLHIYQEQQSIVAPVENSEQNHHHHKTDQMGLEQVG